MPLVPTAPHLLQYSLEIGLCKSSGMGIAPIDWVDINAWVELTGTAIHPEEARIIRGLSSTFVTQTSKSKKQDCPAPFFSEETQEAKSDNIKMQMKRFKNRRFDK